MTKLDIGPAIIKATKDMTAKDRTIKRLNELRIENSLPPYDPKKVKMTVAEMEALIYRLETPSDNTTEKPTPPTTAELLRKRNVLASHLDLPRLKAWKGSRDKLEKQIEEYSAKTSHVDIKKIPPAVADGVKTRRALDTSKMQQSIKKMDKAEQRKKLKEAKETARKIAVTFDLKATNVFEYLQWKNVTRPTLAGEALVADIKAYLANRAKVLSKAPKKGAKAAPRTAHSAKRAAPGMLTPSDLAELLDKAPRAIRIKLRAIEKSIPSAWRGEGRWAFHTKHKDDILKLLKGG